MPRSIRKKIITYFNLSEHAKLSKWGREQGRTVGKQASHLVVKALNEKEGK